MAGTLVGTPDGQAAVETLKRGDLVMTRDGRAKPVTWLGRQTVSTCLPIRCGCADPYQGRGARRQHASRDLLLSPDHAVSG